MLILKRGIGQQIIIDSGRIRVSVVSVKGDTVRLGFEAPADVSINRAEVHERLVAIVELEKLLSRVADADPTST